MTYHEDNQLSRTKERSRELTEFTKDSKAMGEILSSYTRAEHRASKTKIYSEAYKTKQDVTDYASDSQVRGCAVSDITIARRKVKRLLDKLSVLTPDSVATRWRIIDTMLRLLLEKRERRIPYMRAYVRNRDLVRKIRRPTSVSNVIRMLLHFKPPFLKPLDPTESPPQTQFTIDGISLLKNEITIWNEIFNLTDEFDLLRPLIEILSKRLDEVDRYVQGSSIDKSKTE